MSNARERLAELRANRTPQSPNFPQSATRMRYEHEMEPINHNGQQGSPAEPSSTGFLDEIGYIRDQVRLLNAAVNSISGLHARSIQQIDPNALRESVNDLESELANTRNMINNIKTRIQRLENEPVGSEVSPAVKKGQIATVKSEFLEALQNFQKVEKNARDRRRQRIEHQYRVANAGATDEEVTAALQGNQYQRVFEDAMLRSSDYDKTRSAYRETQTRHEELQNIENTLTELAQLFNEMAIIVEQDDDKIDTLVNQTNAVEEDTRKGLDHTEVAVTHARRARKMKIFCFWFVVIAILAAAGVAAGIICGQQGKCSKK